MVHTTYIRFMLLIALSTAGLLALIYYLNYNINLMDNGFPNNNNENQQENKPYNYETDFRGFLTKEGMVNPIFYLHKHSNIRNESFVEWIKEKSKGLEVATPPLPFPHCQIVINHYYKFIWIKGHKVGGTTLLKNFCYICDEYHPNPNLIDLTYCSIHLSNPELNMTVYELSQYWRDYFVFGFIRNPYSRFVSSHYFVEKGHKDFGYAKHKLKRDCKEFIWPHQYCIENKCTNEIDYLKIPGIDYHYKHFEPQAQCVLTDTLKPAVDYLGTTETLEEDVSNIVDVINERRDPSLPPLIKEIKSRNMNKKREILKKKGISLDEKFFKERRPCYESVNRVYNKDFLLLGYKKRII